MLFIAFSVNTSSINLQCNYTGTGLGNYNRLHLVKDLFRKYKRKFDSLSCHRILSFMKQVKGSVIKQAFGDL